MSEKLIIKMCAGTNDKLTRRKTEKCEESFQKSFRVVCCSIAEYEVRKLWSCWMRRKKVGKASPLHLFGLSNAIISRTTPQSRRLIAIIVFAFFWFGICSAVVACSAGTKGANLLHKSLNNVTTDLSHSSPTKGERNAQKEQTRYCT